jgi:hypothetical protein
MGTCAEPGEPGFNEGLAAGFLLRVALGLLDNVGPGLDLVNALRDRFPGATPEQAGKYATWARESRDAGQYLVTADPAKPMDWDQLPQIAGASLWEENPMDRVRVDANVPIAGVDGSTQWTTITVFGGVDATPAELLQQIYETAQQQQSDYEKYKPEVPMELLWFKLEVNMFRQY